MVRPGRLSVIVLAITALLSTMGAVPAPAQPAPAAGRNQLIIGMSQEPDSLNLMFAGMTAAGSVLSTILVPDVRRDDKWKLFPEGVASMPTLKDGTWTVRGNAMRLVWKLRPRTWSDGRPVTCADVVFTHTMARNIEVPVVVRDLTNRIANVVCPKGAGGTDITVNWKELFAFANLTITEYGALPRHVLEPFYRQNPSKLDQAPYGNDARITIGDGAYRLVEWRKGASVTVESISNHPIYGSPTITRITWLIIPDTNALVAAILSGAVDVAGGPGITLDQGLQLERQAAGRFKIVFYPGLTWEHIDFNLDHPFLQDVRVRRAIAYGIDRELIVQELFEGKQPVSHTYLPPLHPGYAEDVPKYAYDPARARALLQEAGFTAGPDGIMRNAAGQRLSLEINTTGGNRVREQIEVIIQQQLRQIGIEITILNVPARVLFGQYAGQRKFKALIMYAWALGPASDCDQLFTSDGIPGEANGWAGQNYPGYRNAEMDRACKAASRELDETKRNRLLNESARIFARDLPALPLYFRVGVATAKAGLKNIAPGLSLLWNVHRWTWE